MASEPKVLSAGTLTGDRVKNTAGEDLGKVEEIMLDLDDGRVAYVVLSFGGVLGLGDKFFAIPWQALSLSTKDKAFYLNVDKERLQRAPGFDKEHWPGTEAGDDWLVDVYKFYGYQPYWRQ